MAADEAKAKKSPTCPKCGNRLRVRADQMGEQVRCPKCSATFTLGRAAEAKTQIPPEELYEPEIPLVPARIVPEEPVLLQGDGPPIIEAMEAPINAHRPQHEVDWASDELEAEAPHQRPPSVEPEYLELAHERGLVRTEDTRPIPKWTFFSGVFTFPWRSVNIFRWAAMSVALAVDAVFLQPVVELLTVDSAEADMGSPFLMVMAAAMTLVTASFCAACFMAAVDDTADGNDEPQEETFPPLDQWVFSMFSVLCTAFIAAAIGYPLTLVPEIGPLGVVGSGVVLFPILFLSAMECDSFFLPLSPLVWRTLVRQRGVWLAFYVVSTALLAIWFAGAYALNAEAPGLAMLLGAPGLAAVILIYARLLGRLAWRIGFEAAPVDGQAQRGNVPFKSPPLARRSKKRKKVRRLKLNLPDELDQASGGVEDRAAAPRPRLDFHKRS